MKIALCAVTFVLCVIPVAGQECGMARVFMQPDGNAKTGTTAVWSDANGTALLFVESLNVNTDGTRRSYSVDDFWGEKTALNNLCNAMSDRCAGLDKTTLGERRLVTQKAHAAGWPADLLKQTRISSQIIPFKGGKPCPLVDGFLVSATALHKLNVSDVCDINNYLDALTVPAIVVPGNPPGGRSGFAEREVRIGDLAVAMRSGDSNAVYSVVGDTGPSTELGEASIALNGKLLGKTAEPQNYQEVTGRGAFKGRGWVVPRAIVLIFPKSRDPKNPFMTVERIEAEGKKRFAEWGGVKRLTACELEYARK